MKYLWLVLVGVLWASPPAHAVTIIRDAEIETTIKDWALPVARAADLDPGSLNIVLVQSPDINAFVAGGQNIFLYTGLIDKADNADEIVGVLAHEMGHIVGGHLLRTRERMERASYEAILGAIIGLGAAVAAGDGKAGAAAVASATSMAQQRFLSFSRDQESTADQAAVRFLSGAGVNPTGLVTFMQKLADQDVLSVNQQAMYVRTHPLSRDRVDALAAALAKDPDRHKPVPTVWADEFARVKAKLLAFIEPSRVAFVYDTNDHSVAADYARAIAAYRQNQVDDALDRIDALIAREHKNPYFYELKGQMLFDFGRIEPAAAAYRLALEYAPRQPLLQFAYARALIETPMARKETLQKAANILSLVTTAEPRNGEAYRQLGVVYGRMGNEPRAQIYLAEEAWRRGRFDEALNFVESALAKLPSHSSTAKDAQNLRTYIEGLKNKKDE